MNEEFQNLLECEVDANGLESVLAALREICEAKSTGFPVGDKLGTTWRKLALNFGQLKLALAPLNSRGFQL